MGLNQSTEVNKYSDGKYSEDDIKRNIDGLFKKNKKF